ncbi:MAG TPA: hypothetical protein VFI47_23470 [Acidimicrobiales bacterium]|nr:hypothetical protein [Acidimicrobiales bacterium]
MSDDTPPVDSPGDGEPAAAGRSAVAVALRRLAPPEHGKDFWSDLDRRLADEPQLRLAPRAAIRPITQPPPVTDDKKLAAGLTAKADGPPRHRPRFRIFAAALAVVVGLLVIGALSQDPAGDQTATGGDDRPGGSDAAQARGEDAGAEDDQPSTTRAPTPPPGYIDPSAPLDPAGVGPLRIGATFADLQTAGIQVQADQATFRGSGGTCYDARVPGALDLRLRFRNPDGTRRVDDPAQGVLTAISIESSLPTSRPAAGTNFVLGSSQDEVLYAYAANIDDRPNPYVSRGHVYRVDAGNGLGTAYVTDGVGVVQIAVGEMDVIRFVKDCG